ncbi:MULTISPECIES: PRD domain-containing protein [unclassified Brenneria]|uniref:PRD domain-containing protein n=1 Tax=unclassified Brenneria TaxID=2634434 RepID=UPI001551F3C4|nr:PRD domain-containing protein [Brenneria sp. hezel4-2-4]MEE3652300.1 PRD domain-containing protein [Brenneria sp. HEZEL_4_2_4]NPD02257.1 PRD domain-containing protein [Brenneria sp. hezel4-2-4]
MNSFDLAFLKYAQEYSPLAIDEVITKFGKTLSTLKRTMKEINEQLHPAYHLHIDNQFITTAMSYREYIDFLDHIKFNRYITTAEERIRDLSVALCLQDVVNKSEYYRKFHVSPTTLKNDNQALLGFLQANKLTITGIPKLGSRLDGDEILLRIAICLIILKTVEIGENQLLVPHTANEPINKSIALQFLTQCAPEIETAAALYQQRLKPVVQLGYNSKKYFLVYMSIALHRIRRGHVIPSGRQLDFIQSLDFSLLEQQHENQFLNLLISSLTFTRRPFNVYDPTLIQHVRQLCSTLSHLLRARIQNTHDFFSELYQFIYSAIVQNKFNLYFDDKKLHDVQTRYATLYTGVCQATAPIEQHYQTTFSPIHLATLVLILKKYELQNRLYSEPKKRIIIVTNSSESKVGYFKEVLKSHFHIDIVDCVNINELQRLNQLPCDLLITFTNKISNYLKYYRLDYIKVNFYLTRDDIALLSQQGLSRARKKIPLEAFLQETEERDQQQRRLWLEQRYPDFFI